MTALDGLQVRILDTMDDHKALSVLFGEVWRVPHPSWVVDPDTLRALQFAGNYVAGAFVDGRLVGGAAAFTAPDGHMHSHVLGVADEARGRGISVELKRHQRDWALRRGITLIKWTYDPGRVVNAMLNIQRLGGVGVEYLPDFYGAMEDGINRDAGPSDRVVIEWRLDSLRVEQALAGVVVDVSSNVLVPVDRSLLRSKLKPLLCRGFRIVGVTRNHEYILEES